MTPMSSVHERQSAPGDEEVAGDASATESAESAEPGESARPGGSARRRIGGISSIVLCAVPVVFLAVMSATQAWMSDDGWINIRVVEQFLAGNGPVYNAGERVEVTTSTLWFWILLAGTLIPDFAPEYWAAIAGCVLTAGGLVLASLGARQLFRSRRPAWYLPLGALAVAALPPMWDFATSGLETGLAFGWLGLCFWMLARRLASLEDGGTRRPAWWPLFPAIVIGLGPLVRPDFALYSALFALALLATSRFKWWDWPVCLAVALAVPGAYQIFRMGYFAVLVPNTALAKDASNARWGRGGTYLLDYAGTYALLLPVIVAVLVIAWQLSAGKRGTGFVRAVVVLAPVLGGLLHALYIVRVGGDFMHARFLLPDTFALMMPAAVVGVRFDRQRILGALAIVATLTVAVWGVIVAATARPAYTTDISQEGIANERAFWSATTANGKVLSRVDWMTNRPGEIGLGARADLAAGLSYYDNTMEKLPTPDGTGVYVATQNLGILSIAAGTEIDVIDVLALSDGLTSHSVLAPEDQDLSRVGHAPRPDAWRSARYAAPSPDEPIETTHAREAIACGDLAVLQNAITGELTTDKFWENVRLAPRLTFFTFPADPDEARQVLCGAAPANGG